MARLFTNCISPRSIANIAASPSRAITSSKNASGAVSASVKRMPVTSGALWM